MGTNLVLYDRIWLEQYADRISYRRNLLKLLESELRQVQIVATQSSPVECQRILHQIKLLDYSFDAEERAVNDYLNNVHKAAIQLQKECQEIQLSALKEK